MIVAFILATTKTGKETDVIQKLNEYEEIQEAWNVYGDYDVLAKVEISDLDQLNDFLLKKLRKDQNISTTTTMIGL